MKNKKFILTRRNQKGQVAIFVALIFQVVFIFFAILINVGLLVHHKINLQQSTDLAAYYGAMKQAEIMNAISHVNFQMRQAWKLLAWRYRVLGTFGFQDAVTSAQKIVFPLKIGPVGTPTQFMGGAAELTKCATTGVNILDVPFFCASHGGFQGWKNPLENNCRIDCDQLNGTAMIINAIPITGGYDSQYTGGAIGAVNTALNAANGQILNMCQDMGPKNFSLMSKFILSYGAEIQQKKKLIQMLGADLSADGNLSVDMDNGSIKQGSSRTFENNLTEANRAGKISFDIVNGLNGNDCAFTGNANDGVGGSNQFLKEIKLKAVQYFIHQCGGTADSDKNFLPKSLFTDESFTTLDPAFVKGLTPAQVTAVTSALSSVEYIMGYEKNPWCQVYYGAKAQAEPKIPFLPLAKIRLSAISFAKPFGGSIGPRFYSGWDSGSPFSNSGTRVDPNLPPKDTSGLPPGPPSLSQIAHLLPNYANFVGDAKGLKDARVVGAYQDLLLYRQLNNNISDLNISKDKASAESSGPYYNSNIPPGTIWPSYSNWNRLGDPSNPAYDYLATDPIATGGDKNSFLRDLEISVLAPNQFDLNFYSIDPDYFNNYYLKMTGGNAGPLHYAGSYANLKAAAGNYGPAFTEIKPDYGNDETLQGAGQVASGYSVRHQMAVSALVVKAAQMRTVNLAPQYGKDIFTFSADKPASLLTGWTYLNFSDYLTFPTPTAGVTNDKTMTFGRCKDDWNNSDASAVDQTYDTPVSASNPSPPTGGNCVTGGRTGYSVKIVSSSLLRATAPPQDYGGTGGAGPIANPVVETFFSF